MFREKVISSKLRCSLKNNFLFFHLFIFYSTMVEPLLSGIVLGLMAVTLAGLFVAAYLQFKRGNELAL
jgi:cytochrome b6-f complex subunit 5